MQNPASIGTLLDGTEIMAWRIGRPDGLEATVMTYGGNINALKVPIGSRHVNVIVGYARLEDYLADGSCRSAITGRYANRIAGGHFRLDGREVRVSANTPPHMLHGGAVGFDRAVWRAEPAGEDLVLFHRSPDGDQGFPGALDTTVRYRVTDDALIIDYEARTDAPTVVNLTSHAYFNLKGQGDILDHVLTIPGDRFTVVDASLIPTGELRSVAGTPFDFRQPAGIGARIDEADEQLRIGRGYDHNYALADAPRPEPVLSAHLLAGDLAMSVLTTEPGIQLYTGNFMESSGFRRHAALCLETQHFPDSPNHPDFPSTVLRPDETFRSRTIYRFAPPD